MSSIPSPMQPCRRCGTFTRNRPAYCDTHRKQTNKQHNTSRGRNYYHTQHWQQLRASILARDSHQCIVCGSTHRLAVHHMIARLEGGADHPTNLITLCQQHHNQWEQAHPETRHLVDIHMQLMREHNRLDNDDLAY